jgi:glycosyltransferase involved in cell wall biosynthesis
MPQPVKSLRGYNSSQQAGCKIPLVATVLLNSQQPPMQREQASPCGGKRLKGIVAESSAECPLVTVVTAVFNGQPHVAECLESVQRQDYPNIEHIVLDGGSNDGTVEVLRRYDDRIAFWKSEPDNGVYDAWNKSLAQARGEWICFLGADDEFLPGAVSAYMALATENHQAEYLSSKVRWVHPSGYSRTFGEPWTWGRFSKFMCAAHVGSMHRSSLFDRLGTYDISYRSAADYELLLRARHQLNAAYMPVTTVMMRAGGVSDSNAAFEEATRAKITTGGRNATLAAMELRIANAKFVLRPLRRVLGSIVARRFNQERANEP